MVRRNAVASTDNRDYIKISDKSPCPPHNPSDPRVPPGLSYHLREIRLAELGESLRACYRPKARSLEARPRASPDSRCQNLE